MVRVRPLLLSGTVGVAFLALLLLLSFFGFQVTEARKLSECATHPSLSLPPDALTSETATNGYHKWVLEHNASSLYHGALYIPTTSDPCKGMAMHWDIHDDAIFSLAIAVEATGWAAFGMSETGGMRGADIVYYETLSGELIDAYVTDGYVRPTVDDSQDWVLERVTQTDDGFLIVQATRALDTGDAVQDRRIVNDSGEHVFDHIVIGAWGDDDEIFYHFSNRLSSSVQLFPGGDGMSTAIDVFRKDMEERAEGSVSLLLDGYEIPKRETTYYDLCFTNDDLVQAGLFKDSSDSTHVVGFEFLIDPNTVPYVHHITVNGSPFGSGDSCSSAGLPFMAWAPGTDFFHFKDGGIEMGNADNAINAFSIQYHFDNPNGVKNLVDNGSGIVLYYSSAPVEHDIGMFVIGDPLVALTDQPIGNGKTKHEFLCPAECLEDGMTDDEITIIVESHHMHQVGRRMTNQVLRDDSILNEAVIDYYDFDQRGIALVRQEPYTLKKGDSFHTTCYYESQNDATFGLGSREEMCMTFYYYYPKQKFLFSCGPPLFWKGPCSAKYDSMTLDGDSNFDREFEVVNPTPPTSQPNPSPTPPTPNGSTILIYSPMTTLFSAIFGFLIVSY